MSTYITIWRYRIKPEMKKEFEKLYGKNGDWVALFRNYPGYIKTELIKDINNNTYLTLDYWESKETYYDFKNNSKTRFSEIDKKGEELSIEEKHLGEFVNTK